MIENIEALLSKLPPGDQAKLLEQLDEYKRAIEHGLERMVGANGIEPLTFCV